MSCTSSEVSADDPALFSVDDLAPTDSADSAPLAEAAAAYENFLFDRAFELWLPLADTGSAEAQYWIGKMHDDGSGSLERDDPSAVHWYRLAAGQGHLPAINALGVAYAKGEGVAIDEVRAVELFRAAAYRGHASSILNLGKSYVEGTGVEQNDLIGVMLVTRAAELDHPHAQTMLGFYYILGTGVNTELVEAIKWLLLAKDRDRSGIATILLVRLKPLLDSSTLSQAEARAAEFRAEHPLD